MATQLTDIKGGAELQRFLKQLPGKVEKNIMRGAMRAGANVIRDEAKRLAGETKDTGALQKSIRAGSRARGGEVTAYIRAGGKKVYFGRGQNRRGTDVWYAHLIEYGVRPHSIGQGEHPGFEANPYLRPAIDDKQQEAVSAITDYIRNRLRTQHGLNVPYIKQQGDDEPEI